MIVSDNGCFISTKFSTISALRMQIKHCVSGNNLAERDAQKLKNHAANKFSRILLNSCFQFLFKSHLMPYWIAIYIPCTYNKGTLRDTASCLTMLKWSMQSPWCVTPSQV